MPLLNWVLSFLAAGAIGGLAFRLRALSITGFVGAFFIGGIITAAGGWRWGAILLAFFLASSVLSKLADRLRPDHDQNVEKGSRRDLTQVAANGGIAAICAFVTLIDDQSRWFILFAASLAVANADTWATEIGSLSTRAPRLITTGRPAPAGTSGAISPLGSLGSIAGAITIAILSTLLSPADITGFVRPFLAIAVGAIAGSVIDSVLGATVQLQLFCPECGEITEAAVHRCGTPAVYLRGAEGLTNDAVNLVAIAIGAIIGWLIWTI